MHRFCGKRRYAPLILFYLIPVLASDDFGTVKIIEADEDQQKIASFSFKSIKSYSLIK